MQVKSFQIGPEGKLTGVDQADAVAGWRAGHGSFWIDVESNDASAWKRVLVELDFDSEMVDELLEPDHAARALSLDAGLFFEVPTWYSSETTELKSVAVLCVDRLLVTLRPVGGWFAKPTVSDSSVAGLLCALLIESSIELRRIVSDVRKKTAVLSDRIDASPEAVALEEIVDLKREVLDLDAVSDERSAVLEMLATLKRREFERKEHADDFRIAVGNTAATTRRVDRLDRRVRDIQLRYDANQQDKMNRRLSRLTIISAVFLPLTLIAGIYGMNFDIMPELHHPLGYPLIVGGMALIAVGLVWWFRSRGWMD